MLGEWDDFSYQMVGTVLYLAAAQAWVNELARGDESTPRGTSAVEQSVY